MYDRIAAGVERQNAKIKRAIENGAKEKELQNVESNDELASAVNHEFPVALVVINDFDQYATSDSNKLHYPGKLVGYKNNSSGLRRYVDIPLSPFNAWNSGTIKCFGVLMGNDKIGHFTDMGMHYYEEFRSAKRAGKLDEEAHKKMLKLGTEDPIYSERGLLGLATAGDYSNADLVSNYMGFCFYRNLSEPVMLKGVTRPPLCVKDGPYWKVADFVRPDSDFFSWFISNHLNEALNPGYYRGDIRGRIRKAIVESRKDVLTRYTDPNGNCWSAERFDQETHDLFTYWGVDYGHWNDESDLMTIAKTCFAPLPDMNTPTSRNADGLTPMHIAAARNDVDTLKRLIDKGGDVNARVSTAVNAPAVDGDTPLHLAAKNGQVQAVQFLLSRGADVSARNVRGDTPLHMSVEFPQVTEALIKAGANINAPTVTGRTPLHWAARDRQATAGLEVLLNYGAQPEPVDRDGLTPLHDAAQVGHTNAIIALVKGGADPNAQDHFAITPLHLAAAGAGNDVCDLLVRAGANVNAKDAFGATPLMVAARNAQPATVQTLLARGATPNATDAYGSTALSIAKSAHYPTTTQLLEASISEPQNASARIQPSRASSDAH